MKHNVELKEGAGWILITDKAPSICFKCGCSLKTPFFFCRESEKGFCRKCDINQFCKTFEVEHEHFNIIEIKKE